jgi:Ca-activated chloride channel family protein
MMVDDVRPGWELDRLFEQGMAHFRSARWEEARYAFEKLLSAGVGSEYPEADELLADITLKQGMEQVQAPVAAPPPTKGRSGAVLTAFGGLVLAALVLFGGMQIVDLLNRPLPEVSAMPVQQSMVGALPTPAPTTAPALSAVAPTDPGTLVVRLDDGVSFSAGVENVYIILDASGSMLARIGDTRKIDIAQQALGGFVNELPADAQVALRTYGRQRADDCSDVELVNPLAPLDRQSMIAQINGVEPINLSRTPIGASLAQIPTDLAGVTGETLVVLVSDGDENCDGDPIAVAAQVRQQMPNLRISVVGFDIALELQEKLAAIAEAGGGDYFNAADVDQLAPALRQAITATYRVYDAAGVEVADAQVGEMLDLAGGNYQVLVGAGDAGVEQYVTVGDGLATIVTLRNVEGALKTIVTRDWSP